MSKGRRALGIAAAVLLAVIGTIALVSYVRGAKDRELAGEKIVHVYVAADRIPQGTGGTALANKVKREEVPAKLRGDGSVVDLDQVDGLVTSIALLKGEQLNMSRFSKPGAANVQRSATGQRIPLGWFQGTVSLEPAQALGGSVKIGDRVAVVAEVDSGIVPGGPKSGVVARNAIVTNVQIDGDKGDSKNGKEVTSAPTGKFLVTLAVPQEDLERIVFASSEGTVWLATEPSAG
jgi:pilus assembly protein CpaB